MRSFTALAKAKPMNFIPDGGTYTPASGITFTAQNANKRWSARRDPRGYDRVRFEVRSGDEASVDSGTGKERSELYYNPGFAQGIEYWMSYSVMMENDPRVAIGSTHLTFGQFHANPEVGDDAGLSPNFDNSISTSAAGWLLRTRTAPGNPTLAANVVVTAHSFSLILTPFTFYDLVIAIIVDPAGSGRLRVWRNVNGAARNETPLFDYSGAIGYVGNTNYWKWGIYSGHNTAVRAVEFANMEGPTTSSLLARVTAPKALNTYRDGSVPVTFPAANSGAHTYQLLLAA